MAHSEIDPANELPNGGVGFMSPSDEYQGLFRNIRQANDYLQL